jgi:dTDP-4-dehydrorhamnose 3,5-epimerase
MMLAQTPIVGAWLIDIEPRVDERGFFARMVCAEQFGAAGLASQFVQQSISFNTHKGIVRGLHYQAAPHAEEKLVRVTQGEIWDVMVDLRPQSPTFRQWHGVVLSAANRRALYIPKGIAHGFQTLVAGTEVSYQMTVAYCEQAARGVHWRDPGLAIAWPDPDGAIISRRDRDYQNFDMNEPPHE